MKQVKKVLLCIAAVAMLCSVPGCEKQTDKVKSTPESTITEPQETSEEETILDEPAPLVGAAIETAQPTETPSTSEPLTDITPTEDPVETVPEETPEAIVEDVTEDVVQETPSEPEQAPVATGTNVWGEVTPAQYGVSYGTISCAPAGIYAPLIWGDDYGILSQSCVAQYAGSTQVGYNGCHLLLAHNYGEFAKLAYVSIGDIFTVDTAYGHYEYQVESARSGYITADEGNIVDANGHYMINLSDSVDRLYMYTCYPFGYYDNTPQRYVVTAVRI